MAAGLLGLFRQCEVSIWVVAGLALVYQAVSAWNRSVRFWPHARTFGRMPGRDATAAVFFLALLLLAVGYFAEFFVRFSEAMSAVRLWMFR